MEFFTIANLDDLSGLLRRVYDRYGRPRPGGGALYLTEFGYQTNPPDPIAVTPKQQSVYLNHSEFIAWRNPRVRTLAQFLLVDDKPLPGYPRTVGRRVGRHLPEWADEPRRRAQAGVRELPAADPPPAADAQEGRQPAADLGARASAAEASRRST